MFVLSAVFGAYLYALDPICLAVYAGIYLVLAGINVINAAYGHDQVRRKLKVRYIDSAEQAAAEGLSDLYAAFESVVRKSDLKGTPRLFVSNKSGSGAFSYQPIFSTSSSIGMSMETLQRLDCDEIEAVLGHEAAHLKKTDVFRKCAFTTPRLALLIFGAFNLLAIDPEFIWDGMMITSAAYWIFLISTFMVSSSSRRSELACDAYGAWLTQSDKIGPALTKMIRMSCDDLEFVMECSLPRHKLFRMDPYPTLRERLDHLEKLGA